MDVTNINCAIITELLIARDVLLEIIEGGN